MKNPMENRPHQMNIHTKLKQIISKYYTIEAFQEQEYSFFPLCIILGKDIISEKEFEKMRSNFREIGFDITLNKPNSNELKACGLEPEKKKSRYLIKFKAKDFSNSPKTMKKERKIQLILAIITIGLVIFSGFFYVLYLEPYYGSLYRNSPEEAIPYIVAFCIGMFSIIVVHEFGHIFFARYHDIDTSYPFLIPGPPPLGMLGAYVKIKSDPQSRNHKFDSL